MENNEKEHKIEAEAIINPDIGKQEREQEQILPEQLVSLMENRLESGNSLDDLLQRKGDVLIGTLSEDLELKKSARAVQEKSRGLWEAAKGKIMRAGAIGLAILAFTGAGEFGPAQAQAAERPRVESNLIGKDFKSCEEKMRRAVFENKNEVYAILTGEAGKFATAYEGEGGDTFFSFNLYDISTKIEKSRTSEILIMHTHPEDAKQSFFKNQPGDKLKEIPIPPSIPDFHVAAVAADYFAKDGIRAGNAVIDSTGRWDFNVDLQNPFIKGLNKLTKEAQAEIFGDLSNEERDLLRRNGKGLENIDPRALISHYKEIPETKKIAEKLYENYEKMAVRIMGQQWDEDADNLVFLQSQIATSGQKTELERAGLISRFIESARKKGITIKYNKFSENQQGYKK